VTAEGEETGRKAKEAMGEASEKYMVLAMDLEPRCLWKLIIMVWCSQLCIFCDPRFLRISYSKVWEQLLERFSGEDDIAFAYLTQRSFSNITEGKKGTRLEGKSP